VSFHFCSPSFKYGEGHSFDDKLPEWPAPHFFELPVRCEPALPEGACHDHVGPAVPGQLASNKYFSRLSTTNNPKTHIIVTIIGIVPVAVGAAQIVLIVVESTPAQHTR